MRIVINCNVLIAAKLKDGLCRALLRKVLEKEDIYLSREVLLEYLLVSQREKFKAHKQYLEKLIELLAEASTIIESMTTKFTLPDMNDKKYIDLAISAQAKSYLIQAIEVVKTFFPETSPNSIRVKNKLKNIT